MKKIGLLVGREWSFPPAFIKEVNGRDTGVQAEYVELGGTMMAEPCQYAVIVDRVSHKVPYYRSYLKNAVLQGVTVINNPFMWTADDKYFQASLATKLGVASPKTIVLPNKDYIPGIVHGESLRNLIFPLDWEAILNQVGLPCVLKDAHGHSRKEVHICYSKEDLWQAYDQSGLLTMVVQEYIEWEHYVRCMCLGQKHVLPMKYDPEERQYHVEHDHLGEEMGKRVVDDALKLVKALGYDMNTVEFGLKDGVPYAIDFMNPVPGMDIHSLTPHYFEWVVQHMANMVIEMTLNPRPQAARMRWSDLF